MKPAETVSSVNQHPVQIPSRLIRFETTKPPAIKSECISHISRQLANAGIPVKAVRLGSEAI